VYVRPRILSGFQRSLAQDRSSKVSLCNALEESVVAPCSCDSRILQSRVSNSSILSAERAIYDRFSRSLCSLGKQKSRALKLI
jgi:hypothetical protein